jgi:hypothetical protein
LVKKATSEMGKVFTGGGIMDACTDDKILKEFEKYPNMNCRVEVVWIHDRYVTIRLSMRTREGPILSEERNLNKGDVLSVIDRG